MKNLYILLAGFLVAVSFRTGAQTVYPNCLDGTIYLKTYDTSTVQLVPYNNNIPQLNALINKYGIGTMRHAFRTPDPMLQRIYRFDFQQSPKVDSLIIELQQLGFVEYSEKVDMCLTSQIPNDLSSVQWHLNKIDAPTAWDITTGSPSVVIAIVDNAVKITHPDLVQNIWVNDDEIPNNGLDDDLDGYIDDVNGYDVADNDNNPNPPASTTFSSPFNHGTHCAGIASAATNNNLGIASIGYSVKIMAVKCTPDTSSGGALLAAYEGIDYAISAGANIISMSFGSTSAPFTGQFLMDAAHARGIVLVAAAGNAGSSVPNYPAAFNNVIGVGATDQSDHKASFSNYGSYVDVMAPGVSIYSTVAGGNSYGSLSGTSMACPLVAGLTGLILSKNGNLTPNNVEVILEAGCENINALNPAYAGQMGAGRINAFNSLSLVPVSMSEVLPLHAFSVAPNPSDGHFRILMQDMQGEGTVRIINAIGQVVYEAKSNSSMLEISQNFEKKGLYLVEVIKDNVITGKSKIIID